jgi:hypothetical protein
MIERCERCQPAGTRIELITECRRIELIVQCVEVLNLMQVVGDAGVPAKVP